MFSTIPLITCAGGRPSGCARRCSTAAAAMGWGGVSDSTRGEGCRICCDGSPKRQRSADRTELRFASGDFDGSGEWTIHAVDPSLTEATYVWAITATKPLLKYLSPLLRPLFEWNHRWAMSRGEESLREELKRRAVERRRSRQEMR